MIPLSPSIGLSCTTMGLMTRFLLTFASWVLVARAVVAADLLLVINKGDNTLAIIDAATLNVLGTAPTGPDPHEVVASADGKLAYITNYNAGNGFANSLSVVDLVARTALPPIDLGALARPHGITLSDGKIYFSAEGAKVVARYDPATRKVDWVIGTGQDRTHMVIVSSDRKLIFTTNVASATVSILEERAVGRRGGGGPPPGTPPPGALPPGAAGRGQAGRGAGFVPFPTTDWYVTTIPVGAGAEGYDLSPNGRELWVANAQAGTVSVIDVAAKKVAETLTVAFRSANRLKFTPDGKIRLHLGPRWHRGDRDGRGDAEGNQADRRRWWGSGHSDVGGRRAGVRRRRLPERRCDHRRQDAAGEWLHRHRSWARRPGLGRGTLATLPFTHRAPSATPRAGACGSWRVQ